MCTVTHLRLSTDMQRGSSFAQSLIECLSSSGGSSHRAALHYLAIATVSDHGLLTVDPRQRPVPLDIVLASLLSAPISSNRNRFLHMLSGPDIDRARRDARAAMQTSQAVMRRAVSAVCALEDPHLTPLLLAWLLREERDVGHDGQAGDETREVHDLEIERMIILLPQSASDDARVRAALLSSRHVRGPLLSRLLQIQAGLSWADAVTGLNARDIAALISLHLRSKWVAADRSA